MPRSYDPEITAALAARQDASGAAPPAPADIPGLRTMLDQMLTVPPKPGADDGLIVTDHQVDSTDGATFPVRCYRPQDKAPSTVVVYLHGGGRFAGSIDTHDLVCRRYAAGAGVAVVSVGYRLAPEHPYPAQLEDAYAAVGWADQHRVELGFRTGALVVAGDSAGGGLAAGVALMLRDRSGPQPDLQMLIYPMLDDRTVADPAASPLMTWTPEMNALGWRALLGDAAGGPDVPAYAAPARAKDLAGLPRTYLEVGELDLFLGETLEYGTRLAAAGIPLELHVHQGVPHGGETLAPRAQVARRIMDDRIRVLRSLDSGVE